MTKPPMLHISPDLDLPANTITSTLLVYGGKGMGKSVLGSVVLEELTRAGYRWSAIDPMGVLWGIRHSVDGKGPGFACLILGGPHGDLPIEPTAGAVVADLVVDNDVSVVIDISRKVNGEMWSIGERMRFMTEYGRRLFARQGSLLDGQRREPLFQLIDEAARFMPQTIRQGDTAAAQCMGVWATIVEEGRNIGLGIGLITQRSARLNKDVAELADIMLAFRTVGPNSLAAVLDWLGEHVPKEKIKTMIEQVRSLPVGSALAVSPGWLKHEGVIRIRPRETFDSSATPKPGQQARKVQGKGARPVDLTRYAALMRETVEKATADDPKTLRNEIASLKSQLTALTRDAQKMATAIVQVERIDRTKVLEAQQQEWDRIQEVNRKHYQERWAKVFRDCLASLTGQQLAIDKLLATILNDDLWKPAEMSPRMKQAIKAAIVTEDLPTSPRNWRSRPDLGVISVETPKLKPMKDWPKPSAQAANGGNGKPPGKAERRILTALAQLGPRPLATVAAYSGYSSGGGHFRNVVSACRTSGWLTGTDPLALTEEGAAALGEYQPLPSGIELLHLWQRKTGKAGSMVLQTLAESPRVAYTRDELAHETGYGDKGGHFRNVLSELRTLQLIEGSTEIKLTKEFAEAIRQ